tara:strand:+ start:254 stop:535 length:282 start_codon:yes stop_codon:yes gene_type:complete
MKELYKHVVLKNKITLSVQASSFHYCTPRTDEFKNWESYDTVEVGFIVNGERHVTPPEEWRDYAEESFPSDIYARVPVQLVIDFIKSNGGEMK